MVLVIDGPAYELLIVFIDEEGPGLPAGRDLLQCGGFVDAAAGSGRAGQTQLSVAGDVSVAEGVLGAPDVEVGAAESRLYLNADLVGAVSVVGLDVDGDLEAVAALAVEVIVAALFLDLAGGGEVDDALLPGSVAQIEVFVRFESAVEFGKDGRRAVQRGVLSGLLPDSGASGLTIVIDRGAAVVEELLGEVRHPVAVVGAVPAAVVGHDGKASLGKVRGVEVAAQTVSEKTAVGGAGTG